MVIAIDRRLPSFTIISAKPYIFFILYLSYLILDVSLLKSQLINQMESDLIFKILAEVNYPLLYRHDRNVYKQAPQIDPLQLMKKGMIASFVGYWVGKFSKRRQGLFAFAFALPFGIKYIYDQGTLMKSMRKYEQFSIESSLKNTFNKSINSTDKNHAKLNKRSSSHRVVRQIPRLQNKIYNASDFINQLQKDYFQ